MNDSILRLDISDVTAFEDKYYEGPDMGFSSGERKPVARLEGDYSGMTFNKVSFRLYEIRANFENCIFNSCGFEDCVIHESSSFKGVTFNNGSFFQASFEKQDLSGSTFDDVAASTCQFNGANMSDAAFNGVEFLGCEFSGANLSRVRTCDVSFESSDAEERAGYGRMNIEGADFSGVTLLHDDFFDYVTGEAAQDAPEDSFD